MYKLLVLSFLIIISHTVLGQFPYSIDIVNEPYIPLDLSASVHMTDFDEETYWDDPEFTAQIGFSFPISDLSIQSLAQNDLGSSWVDLSNAWETVMFELTDVDFIDRGIVGEPSLIHWLTIGEEGNQVFTLEYKDVGFYEESDFQTMPSFMNFQMKFYEATGEIVFHFGSSNIAEPEPGYFSWSNTLQFNFTEYPIDLTYEFDYGVNMAGVGEWWSCPTGDCLDDYYDLYGLYFDADDMGIDQVSVPTDGTIWNFTPSSTSIIESSNVTTSNRNLEKVVDALGREVNHTTNQILFYIYDDGSAEKKFIVE